MEKLLRRIYRDADTLNAEEIKRLIENLFRRDVWIDEVDIP